MCHWPQEENSNAAVSWHGSSWINFSPTAAHTHILLHYWFWVYWWNIVCSTIANIITISKLLNSLLVIEFLNLLSCLWKGTSKAERPTQTGALSSPTCPSLAIQSNSLAVPFPKSLLKKSFWRLESISSQLDSFGDPKWLRGICVWLSLIAQQQWWKNPLLKVYSSINLLQYI